MKITGEQYSELVQKLAGEILDSAIEVEAGAGVEDEGMEVEAGIKDIPGLIRGAKNAKNIGNSTMAKHLGKQAVKNAAPVAAGVAGAGAVAGGAFAAMKKKKQEKEAAAQEEGFDKEAAEQYFNEVTEKAAFVFEQSQLMKEAALQVLAEAEAYEEAAMKVAEELGLLDEESIEE